jgi:protein-tyrosine phosphatase
MYNIIPRLYLSNFYDAKTVPNGWYVINCSKDLPMVSTYGMRLAINDDLSQEAMRTMHASLPMILRRIENIRNSGGDVLVHCYAGQQRSAAVVAAYLMSKGMSKAEAIRYIKSRKSDAFLTGVNFDPVLTRYSV